MANVSQNDEMKINLHYNQEQDKNPCDCHNYSIVFKDSSEFSKISAGHRIQNRRIHIFLIDESLHTVFFLNYEINILIRLNFDLGLISE